MDTKNKNEDEKPKQKLRIRIRNRNFVKKKIKKIKKGCNCGKKS